MHWLDRIWEGNIVYEEPVCFAEEADGTITGGKLLYNDITRIISVTSYDGAAYEAGVDYVLEGSRIVRLPGSRIPVLPRSKYCVPYTGNPETIWRCLPGKAMYAEVVNNVYEYQPRVTYEHADAWNDVVPAAMGDKLPRTKARLAGGKPLKIVFYGDSITAGWEASGHDEMVINMQTLEEQHVTRSVPPYMPTWVELSTRALRSAYPAAEITKVNRGSGGATVGWGEKNAAQLVNPFCPDVMPLAFGMNGMRDDPAVYREKTENIIRTVRESNPDCEVVLLSPMTANREMLAFENHTVVQQEQMLREIAASLPGVAVAPVNEVFRVLEKRGKTYWELTGNCINHPNDFSIRVYAQTLLAAMGE